MSVINIIKLTLTLGLSIVKTRVRQDIGVVEFSKSVDQQSRGVIHLCHSYSISPPAIETAWME